MRRLILFAACVAAIAGACVSQTIYYVDVVSGSNAADGSASHPFQTIRYAVGQTYGGTGTFRILVRGRSPGGVAVPHTDALENWSDNGLGQPNPIWMPKDVRIEWDIANSDMLPFPFSTPTPVVLDGAGLTSPSGNPVRAFSYLAADDVQPATAGIQGLHIVGFEIGIDLRPVAGPAAHQMSPHLDQLVFNQCLTGIAISNRVAIVPVNPLVTACRFDNTPQPPQNGGGGPGPRTLSQHVLNETTFYATASGTFENCTFRTDAVNGAGAPISVFAGFYNRLFVDGPSGQNESTAAPTLRNCSFTGNAVAGINALNGMAHGFALYAIGRCHADFLIDHCYFTSCALNGITMYAAEQGPVVMSSEAGGIAYQQGPSGARFIRPIIENSTATANGFVGAATFGNIADVGHGIATRAYMRGLLAPQIRFCTATGVSAGFPNLGISANALDGVFIHSDWEVDHFYEEGSMAFTRNDTRVTRSEIFLNDRHGVDILLIEGSGNPGVEANLIYHNEQKGVYALAVGTTETEIGPDDEPTNADRVVATPVVWNNFIYNTSQQGVQRQDIGVHGVFIQATRVVGAFSYPTLLGGIGVYHNSICGNLAQGIWVDATLTVSPFIEGVQGNISYFNGAGLNIVFGAGTVNHSYNCTPTLIGPGNVNANPLFVNRLQGNLHLSATSPCINAEPTPPPPPLAPLVDDIDLGDVRPKGAAYDIGADEF